MNNNINLGTGRLEISVPDCRYHPGTVGVLNVQLEFKSIQNTENRIKITKNLTDEKWGSGRGRIWRYDQNKDVCWICLSLAAAGCLGGLLLLHPLPRQQDMTRGLAQAVRIDTNLGQAVVRPFPPHTTSNKQAPVPGKISIVNQNRMTNKYTDPTPTDYHTRHTVTTSGIFFQPQVW